MSNGNRPTGGDLALEDGDHAAVRAEHIAETHCGENGFRRTSIVLHDHFAHALGRPHDACGVNRLIGGDEDEARRPICISSTNGIQRAEYVVVNGLARAMLHKRDVFMGSRMKHRARAIFRKHLVDALLVTYVTDLDDDIDVVIFGQKLVAQHVRIILVNVEDDDASRRHRAQLTAQLAADGTAAASDQHGFAGDITGNRTGGIVREH